MMALVAALVAGCSQPREVHKEQWRSVFFMDTASLLVLRMDFDDNVSTGAWSDPDEFNIEQKLFRFSLDDSSLELVADLEEGLESSRPKGAAYCHPWLLYETRRGRNTVGLYNLDTQEKAAYPLPIGEIKGVSQDGRYLIFKDFIYDRLQEKDVYTNPDPQTEGALWIDGNAGKAILVGTANSRWRSALIRLDLATSHRDTLSSSDSAAYFKVGNGCRSILGYTQDRRTLLVDLGSLVDSGAVQTTSLGRWRLDDAEIDTEAGYGAYAGPSVLLYPLSDSGSARVLLVSSERNR